MKNNTQMTFYQGVLGFSELVSYKLERFYIQRWRPVESSLETSVSLCVLVTTEWTVSAWVPRKLL